MKIREILTPERTFIGVLGDSKKRVLENIAEFIQNHSNNLNAHDIFDHLISRERLGSTGIGKGIAIPHCRLPGSQSTFGALIRLDQKIAFDAIDDKPVDILFVMLVPEEAHDEHLQTLATIAELFDNDEFCSALRNASAENELYETATNWQNK